MLVERPNRPVANHSHYLLNLKRSHRSVRTISTWYIIPSYHFLHDIIPHSHTHVYSAVIWVVVIYIVYVLTVSMLSVRHLTSTYTSQVVLLTLKNEEFCVHRLISLRLYFFIFLWARKVYVKSLFSYTKDCTNPFLWQLFEFWCEISRTGYLGFVRHWRGLPPTDEMMNAYNPDHQIFMELFTSRLVLLGQVCSYFSLCSRFNIFI